RSMARCRIVVFSIHAVDPFGRTEPSASDPQQPTAPRPGTECRSSRTAAISYASSPPHAIAHLAGQGPPSRLLTPPSLVVTFTGRYRLRLGSKRCNKNLDGGDPVINKRFAVLREALRHG